MRARSLLAASTAATALALAAPTAWADGPGPVTTCTQGQLAVAAVAADQPHVLKLSIKNTGLRPCLVDQLPTVTFGDLDGAAVAVPAGESGPYVVAATRSAYAAVRTVTDADLGEARSVDHVTVFGDPSHQGTVFTAAALGASGGVPVWEPVTTWWHPAWDEAEQALADAS